MSIPAPLDLNMSLRPRFATHWMIGAGVFGVMLQQLAIILGGLAGITSGLGLVALVTLPLAIAGMIVGSAAQDSRTLECFLGGVLVAGLSGLLNSLPPHELSLISILLTSTVSGTVTAAGSLVGRLAFRR